VTNVVSLLFSISHKHSILESDGVQGDPVPPVLVRTFSALEEYATIAVIKEHFYPVNRYHYETSRDLYNRNLQLLQNGEGVLPEEQD
jgi:hypothetical protein